MKTSKNILVLLLITFTLTACKNESQPEIKSVATSTEVDKKTELDPNATYAMAEFTIEGMTCQVGCANTIEKKLAKMEGVKSANVDFESKLAMVEFDESKLNMNTIETAVTAVGDVYTVKNMKTVNSNEAKADTKKKCDSNCTKACCKEKTEAEKKACAEDCKKACCASKA